MQIPLVGNSKGLKVRMPVFQLFYEMKLKTSKFKVLEDIMMKFKSQALCPLEQATRTKHFDSQCMY